MVRAVIMYPSEMRNVVGIGSTRSKKETPKIITIKSKRCHQRFTTLKMK